MNKKQHDALLDTLTGIRSQVELAITAIQSGNQYHGWTPPGGEFYFITNGIVQTVGSSESFRLFGGEFQTYEEAEQAQKDISRRLWLTHLAKELNEGWEPDWNDNDQGKFFLSCDIAENEWEFEQTWGLDSQNVYFSESAIGRLIEMLKSGQVVLP